jgi:hypothetical protein
MLYLKLYEAFNREDFYITIDNDDVDEIIENRSNLLSHPDESIYNRLLSKIYNYPFDLKRNQSLNNRYACGLRPPGLGDILCIGLNSKISESTYSEFGIYSMDDEYYFVSYYTWSPNKNTKSTFYKCDQLEGLLRLLKDKGVIK